MKFMTIALLSLVVGNVASADYTCSGTALGDTDQQSFSAKATQEQLSQGRVAIGSLYGNQFELIQTGTIIRLNMKSAAGSTFTAVDAGQAIHIGYVDANAGTVDCEYSAK